MPRKGENIYKRKDGRWEARYIYSYRDDGKARYHSVYATDYMEVKRKQKEAIKNFNPRLAREVDQNRTISFYGDYWLKKVQNLVKESTYVRYQFLYSHYIEPVIGEKKICQFDTQMCETYFQSLLHYGGQKKTGLSPKTVCDVRSALKAILKIAEKDGFILSCDPDLCTIKSTKAPLPVFSRAEQTILQNYLLEHMNRKSLGVLIGLYTGMRIGEICALQWKDIDFSERYIEVKKTMQRLPDSSTSKTKVVITLPKTESSIRKIPVPDFLLEILKEQKKDIDPEAFVVSGSVTKRYEPRALEYHYMIVLKKCQIPYIHFHALRHTFASRCIELGFDVKTLSEILGHSNISTTMNRYVHPSMEEKMKNMDLLSAVFTVK